MPSIPGLPLLALTRCKARLRFSLSQTSSIRCSSIAGLSVAIKRRSSGTVCLVSGSCSSARIFAPRFFQTTPHNVAFALRYPFSSTRMGRGLPPPSCQTCSAHNKRAQPAGCALLFASVNWLVYKMPAVRSMWRSPSRRGTAPEKLNPANGPRFNQPIAQPEAFAIRALAHRRGPKPTNRLSPYALRVMRGVLLDEFLLVGRDLIHDENRIGRTHRDTGATINAAFRVHIQLGRGFERLFVLLGMDAVS